MRKQAHGAVVQHHLAVIARHAIGREKVAELGGSGNDIPFEQAFSNLAHAYLREKAPTLLDHELGFQLLDRNQENTKAIGVFGFNVGSAIIYAPVFFLNGNLKGHELLYLKNQDQFVPLKENWLNDILNRKPNILGKGVTRNSSQLGMQPPDFTRLVHSPASKYGSANVSFKQEMQTMLPVFAKMATADLQEVVTDLGDAMNLPRFLKEAGMQMIERLVTTCQEYPELAAKLDEFHGLKIVEDAVKTAGARLRKQAELRRDTPTIGGKIRFHEHPLKTGALKVITYDTTIQTTSPIEMSEEDREKLLADKVLIKDTRTDDEVSIPYNVQVEQRLQNPQETGLYEVLTRPDNFEKCLIVVNPTGPDGTTDFATIVRVGDGDGGANWMNTPSNAIWVSHQYDKTEFNDWWEKLRKPESLSKGDSRYILIGPGGTATLPFRIEQEYVGGDDASVYEVDFDDYCNKPKRTGLRATGYDDTLSYDRWRDGQRIHLGGKQGTKLRSMSGDVYVPEDYRLVTARATNEDKETDGECSPCTPYQQGSSDAPPIRPGDLADVQLHLTMPKFGPRSKAEKTEPKTAAAISLATPLEAKRALVSKLTPLELSLNAGSYVVNGKAMTKRAALLHLVCDHGFREDMAAELLTKANCPRTYVCHVKYADAYPPMGAGPGASPYLRDYGPTTPAPEDPPIAGGSFVHDNVPTQFQHSQALPIPELSGTLTDPQIYNPNPKYDRQIMPPEVQRIMQAAQSGQREVFDTAMIGTMLKAVRDDTMVDRYLGDLQKGLDRLGRILFMFYWHGDSFAERYGKQDLPELEDSLRNAFEMLGDVILFLKQKTIQPYPEEDGNDIDLQSIANQ